MNKSKQNRRLKSLWYKRDFKKWIQFKEKIGRYPKGTKSTDKIFLIDSAIWNTRFTHEEEINTHYPDWNPYCCNLESSCSSRAWDRMTKTENGWKCSHCGLIIGKHLFRILDERTLILKPGNFHNFRGTSDFEYVKLKRPVTQIAIGERDINVLKDFMETNQRVFPNLDVVEEHFKGK